MKTSNYIITIALTLLGFNLVGQQSATTDYLNKLPEDLELKNEVVSKYRMVTDYLDYDLKSIFIKKTRVSGIYTCGLENDFVKWNDVRVSQTTNENGVFPEGIKRDYMEDFTYVPGVEAVSESFFVEIPQADFQVRNLIWDRLMFDCFAYWDWDSLQLNSEYLAKNLNGTVNLAGQGNFSNSDIRLTWNGITLRNDEICAVIQYAAMNNPLNIETEGFSMQGRSHYWGDVVVSLEDKEIEHGTMSEDVITDVNIAGQPDNYVGYTVRYITLEKIK